jgi:hypothetical protein
MSETGDTSILFPMANELDGVFLISDVLSEYQAYTSDGITLGMNVMLKCNMRSYKGV